MDDAARRIAERIMQEFHRDDNVLDGVTAIIAAALREVEAERDRERLMRLQLSDDSQRHLDRALKAEARLARVEAALEIETLRDYHKASFSDPPSYHLADATTLWDCAMCVEKYIERIPAALTPDATPEGT